MEYKIVYGDSPSDINTKVNEMITDGWEPIGSHQVVVRREQNRYSGSQHMDTLNQLEYTQTMVRKTNITGKGFIEVRKTNITEKDIPKRSDVIEVDISFYHPNNDETKRVYDEEGMREEFEYKLDCVIKNAGL